MSVMFYKAVTPEKQTNHGRHAVQLANVCSYKLGKNEFQFLCELGWFLHGQSHIVARYKKAL